MWKGYQLRSFNFEENGIVFNCHVNYDFLLDCRWVFLYWDAGSYLLPTSGHSTQPTKV